MDMELENIKIESMIFKIRDKQVMLASDVAKLYNTETKIINQVVKRNLNRFPLEFCFQLNKQEIKELCSRSQNVTLNNSGNLRGSNIKYLPYVFTEHGIMMLSGLLKSEIAAKVNVAIINAFMAMKKYISDELMEQKYINSMVLKHDNEIQLLCKTVSKFEEKNKINEIYFNGQIYDAYSKIKDILSKSRKELIIVDAYADKSVLDIIRDINVKVTLITKSKSLLTITDIKKYNIQYNNLKIIYNDSFHDRYFILDNNIIYHCGTSINHAGNKTFSINKLEDKMVKEALINKIESLIYNNEQRSILL